MSSLPADSSASAKAGWDLMKNINESSFMEFQIEEGANVLDADFDLCEEDYLRQLLVDAEEAHRFLHKLGSKTEEMAGLVSILAASLRDGDSLDSIIAAYHDRREDVEDYDLEPETRLVLWKGIFRPITASAATQRKAMRAEAELSQGGFSALSMLSQNSSYLLLDAEISIQDKEASLAMQPRNAAVASAWHRLSKARTMCSSYMQRTDQARLDDHCPHSPLSQITNVSDFDAPECIFSDTGDFFSVEGGVGGESRTSFLGAPTLPETR